MPRTAEHGGLLDSAPTLAARVYDASDRQVFDRLTRLIAVVLDVPVALIAVADGDELLFASCFGPEEPWGSTPGIPYSHSACQHAILSQEPLMIEDARTHPLVRDSPAIGQLGIVAYLGVPLVTSTGTAIGTLCAIDSKPRVWTDEDARVLEDLGATVMAYIDARPATQSSVGGLNIAAVAQRTGIGADTLRKWERRYGVLRPGRTAGGQRRYDEHDVARVEWLRDRLKEGFRIGEAAALLENDVTGASSSPTDLRDEIVQAVSEPDTKRLPTLVDQAFTLHGVETAIEEIVGPALRTVGDRWQDGAECVAEERLLSEVVQSHLQSLLGDRRHPVRGTAVLACAPGERHELGLLALAVLLQADGWLAVYLGDAPLESSYALAARMGAELLCLSASSPAAVEAVVKELARLGPTDGLRVAVGGPGVRSSKQVAPAASFAGGSLGEAVTALRSA